MKNKAQLAIFVVIALLLMSGIFVYYFINQIKAPKLEIECGSDADCVPASCCHTASCIQKNSAPNCDNVVCTLECRPGTLDCNQGSCLCKNGKCVAIFN